MSANTEIAEESSKNLLIRAASITAITSVFLLGVLLVPELVAWDSRTTLDGAYYIGVGLGIVTGGLVAKINAASESITELHRRAHTSEGEESR